MTETDLNGIRKSNGFLETKGLQYCLYCQKRFPYYFLSNNICYDCFRFKKNCSDCNTEFFSSSTHCLDCIIRSRDHWPSCVKCHIKVESNEYEGLPVCDDCLPIVKAVTGL